MVRTVVVGSQLVRLELVGTLVVGSRLERAQLVGHGLVDRVVELRMNGARNDAMNGVRPDPGPAR